MVEPRGLASYMPEVMGLETQFSLAPQQHRLSPDAVKQLDGMAEAAK
jgi:hypothetical protein